MTDRRCLVPGLVALYDIRPGNGAGPFLQPWGLHGATRFMASLTCWLTAEDWDQLWNPVLLSSMGPLPCLPYMNK